MKNLQKKIKIIKKLLRQNSQSKIKQKKIKKKLKLWKTKKK